ncbi:MAG TPA: hypothetical protein VFL96_13905 [Acidobacteriaceae bacterium]|nr:hypothetical protein [Acidobacteriaceae bacterium]
MKSVAPIPVDRFLSEVFSALERGDASTLRRLEDAASLVSTPANLAEYLRKRDALAKLLEMSARNLRTIRRVTGQHLPGQYVVARY